MRYAAYILNNILNFFLPQSKLQRHAANITAEELSQKIVHSTKIERDTLVLFDYRDELIKNLIWALKYKGNQRVAGIFAEVLYNNLLEELSDRSIFSSFTKPFLVPIPLSKKRLRQRGFNQAELIARQLCLIDNETSFTLDLDLLYKVKDTPSQTSRVNKRQREKNLEGSFAVFKPENVKGKNIILLDDVTTTGSTLKEAEKTLLDAGARQIFSVALAH